MTKQPPKIIYLQDKDDNGEYGGNVAGAEITWCADQINNNDSVYVHQPVLEKQHPRLWAMRFKLDGAIDFYSIRRTKKHCIADFEESFLQPVTPEFMSSWECIKVGIVRL